MEQANQLRESTDPALLQAVQLIVVSPLQRAIQTMQHIFRDSTVPQVRVPSGCGWTFFLCHCVCLRLSCVDSLRLPLTRETIEWSA